jgi:hypothetical protein
MIIHHRTGICPPALPSTMSRAGCGREESDVTCLTGMAGDRKTGNTPKIPSAPKNDPIGMYRTVP